MKPDKLRVIAKRLNALAEKATQGPYFVDVDPAQDTTEHRNSGLALIDTGRQSDWPVLRLGEWPTTEFVAALLNAWPNIFAALTEAAQDIERLQRENEEQRAHSIAAAFKHVDIAKRAEAAEKDAARYIKFCDYFFGVRTDLDAAFARAKGKAGMDSVLDSAMRQATGKSEILKCL